jgi:hypothetical protein
MSRWLHGIVLAAFVLLGGAPAFAQQVSLGASRDVTALAFRGQIGRRVTYVCPPSTDWSQSLWGTGVYTDDSSICRAAVHAGVLADGRPGVVVFVMGAGAETFQGSLQNGVTSRSYGHWGSSFTFDRSGGPGQIDWATTAIFLPAGSTDPTPVICPPGGKVTARIWGIDTYTDDSSICVAAVHAGVITPEAGGRVEVSRAPAQTSYLGSTRFGIASISYGPWQNSFRVSNAAPAIVGRLPSTPAIANGPRPLATSPGRTIALAGFTAAGVNGAVALRTIRLSGFTAVGTTASVAPRSIVLSGFTATGMSVTVAPRTISLGGWTALGTH